MRDVCADTSRPHDASWLAPWPLALRLRLRLATASAACVSASGLSAPCLSLASHASRLARSHNERAGGRPSPHPPRRRLCSPSHTC
eukprot:350388-Chlamydomonas_euryale.AAC.1